MDIRYYRIPRTFDEGARAVMEEAAEVIQIICKAQRFGLHEYHPDDPLRESNASRIFSELEDLRRAISDLEAVMYLDGLRKNCFQADDGRLRDRCCVETDCYLKNECAIHRELT